MLNENYRKAAAAVKTITSKGNSMFGSLLAFAQEFKTNGHEALKEHFKAQEKLANAEMKVEMTKNSTYKVAKGKLIRAVELGIALVDGDGKALGKTALEEKIKEVEESIGEGAAAPKSDFDKFAEAIANAAKKADKLADSELAIAAGLVSELYKKIAERMPLSKAA